MDRISTSKEENVSVLRSSGSWEKLKVVPTHSDPEFGSLINVKSIDKVSLSPTRSIDLQEKVSVRLVKDHGLVVDGDTDKNEGDEDSFPVRSASVMAQERERCCATTNTGSGRRNTVGKNFKVSKFSTISKEARMISRNPNSSSSPDFEANIEGKSKAQNNNNPFSKARHGSSNGVGNVGISSLVPLMDGIKESHKIEVVIKPPPSMMKTYNGSSIHLCCALVFVFSATIFSSLTILLAKVLMNRDHHPISIAFWRYLGILVSSVPLTMFYIFRGKQQKIFGPLWPLHQMDKATNAFALMMRAVLGATAIILRYCSLNFLTIANTSVISYCAPVFAAILGPFCLRKEKAGFIPVLVGILVCFSIFMITQPPFLTGTGWNNDILKGIFLSSSSMFCSSLVLISVRYLIERVHFSITLLFLGSWGVFEAGMLSLSLEVLKVPNLLPDIVMMLGIAVLSFFSQLFILLAMRTGNIGCASVMKSCDILLAFAWQYLFLKTQADLIEVLCAVIIILSVWCVCFRKWLSNLRGNDLIRNKFACLLR